MYLWTESCEFCHLGQLIPINFYGGGKIGQISMLPELGKGILRKFSYKSCDMDI